MRALFPALLFGDAASLQHRTDNGIQVLNYVVVADTEHAKASTLDLLLTLVIGVRAADMAVAVELNYQLMFDTDEIDDVCPDRVLSPHLEFCGTARSQSRPKLALGNGQVAS